MKKAIFGLAIVAIGLSACKTGGKAVKLKNEVDSVSYAWAYAMVSNAQYMKSWDTLNVEVIAAAIKDYYEKGDSGMAISMNNVQSVLETYDSKKYNVVLQKNLDEGQKYWEANKGKEGVVTLDNGLQYKVITPGNGVKPQINDTAICHYTLRNVNGEVLQSSQEFGQPIRYTVGSGIQGWNEALPMMATGSKWELTVPANLAYGKRGNQSIPGNTTLIFEIELLDVVKGKNEAKK
ncbi:MAG: FKBP-type peptidyl-prolyl cis-trans isomerase [Flavobacteriales bacterium]|nr:FKBP-type peptidyl-prolyl cis-trans isomerase [Flavobacteriales bacterium]